MWLRTFLSSPAAAYRLAGDSGHTVLQVQVRHFYHYRDAQKVSGVDPGLFIATLYFGFNITFLCN